jgi:two-component system chemotaxis response regulator CheY
MINPDNAVAEEYPGGCPEQMATNDADLLAIEKGGVEIDGELLNRVCRTIQSVEEAAGSFDLAKVRELAHQTGEVLEWIRSRAMVPTPDRISVLLSATDRLAELMQNPGASNEADVAKILAALSGLRPARRHLRMLLVEDDFASRLLLQTFLSRYGECHVAVNGREAVEAFSSAYERGQRYDLICMDIMMPEMDGREAVRQIRAFEETRGVSSNHGAKIIMTTALNDIREVGRCFNELCDAYFTKPVDLSKLLNQMISWNLAEEPAAAR